MVALQLTVRLVQQHPFVVCSLGHRGSGFLDGLGLGDQIRGIGFAAAVKASLMIRLVVAAKGGGCGPTVRSKPHPFSFILTITEVKQYSRCFAHCPHDVVARRPAAAPYPASPTYFFVVEQPAVPAAVVELVESPVVPRPKWLSQQWKMACQLATRRQVHANMQTTTSKPSAGAGVYTRVCECNARARPGTHLQAGRPPAICRRRSGWKPPAPGAAGKGQGSREH
jgi:hypothetical protein